MTNNNHFTQTSCIRLVTFIPSEAEIAIVLHCSSTVPALCVAVSDRTVADTQYERVESKHTRNVPCISKSFHCVNYIGTVSIEDTHLIIIEQVVVCLYAMLSSQTLCISGAKLSGVHHRPHKTKITRYYPVYEQSNYPLQLLRTIVRNAMPIITLVHNVNNVKASPDVIITANITSQFRDLYSIYCSYINMLTGKTNYQRKTYMDNIVHRGIW